MRESPILDVSVLDAVKPGGKATIEYGTPPRAVIVLSIDDEDAVTWDVYRTVMGDRKWVGTFHTLGDAEKAAMRILKEAT